jgi:hypothetical protein
MCLIFVNYECACAIVCLLNLLHINIDFLHVFIGLLSIYCYVLMLLLSW